MHRSFVTILFVSLATLLPFVSASFGFTSSGFDYVQLMSPQLISWNGQSGDVELRLMKYPPDAVLSYLPIASNLSGTSYTWLPALLEPSSQWTLEGIDSQGNIATSGSSFTVQGTAAAASSGSLSTSLLQQNPQPTASSIRASASSNTPEASPTGGSANTTSSSSSSSISSAAKAGIVVGFVLMLTALIGIAFVFLHRRRQQRKPASVNPFRRSKRSSSPPPFELQDNESVETLHKPMELQGSEVVGTPETSYGRRMELGWGHVRRESRSKRLTIAEGAVETSMGKRMELG